MTATAEREERMTEWSDGRLDEFAQRIDERFDRAEERADDRFSEVNRRFDDVGRRFEEVNGRFNHVDREFARVHDRLDDLVKVMIGGVIALTGAVLAGFAALVVLFATQF
ncbi:MAG TPA: DUF1515 family protein [Solirubrobacterales bacterium]|nr:DUF1515 family protein [Solirubrobacterales bacterium]